MTTEEDIKNRIAILQASLPQDEDMYVEARAEIRFEKIYAS
jgi:hypothetical protein